MKKLIVVATDDEYILALRRFKGHKIIKTGVGGINVVERLKRVPKWVKILNFGYVGSKTIPIGTEVRIGECRSYHPNTKYKEPIYKLNGDTICYTQNEFITPKKEENTVYDMELMYICALGFKNIESIKIVSDSCNEEEYNKYIKKEQK